MNILSEWKTIRKNAAEQWSSNVFKELFSELKTLGFYCLDAPIIPHFTNKGVETTCVFKNSSETTIIISATSAKGFSIAIQSTSVKFSYPSEEEGIVSDPDDLIDVIRFTLK